MAVGDPCASRWDETRARGGLTAERWQLRERVRFGADERFAQGEKNTSIVKELRVSERLMECWRRAWRQGGRAALASVGLPKLTDDRFAELEKELARGPAERPDV